ncbi:hypothetical protein LAZ67_1004575 [Cordylochernes scorpioides]|uniref:Uncharacterized protein n=1 Tax=Cordylochernes scorpioides TaxID=51811 RepID=A0ABY6JZA5_9ARAC|nr:hypothetical protein LAZ67_1004575 [Cordylochernes scorpioides]
MDGSSALLFASTSSIANVRVLLKAGADIYRELMHVVNEAGADANIRFGQRYSGSSAFFCYLKFGFHIEDEAWNRLMRDMRETLMEIADIQLDILLENFREIPHSIHKHSLIRIMVKNYVLLKLELNKPNSIASINELSKWWDDCSDQVNKMQNHVLGKGSVNLRKYLNERDPNIRAHMLFKAGIITQDRIELEISWCHKNFPNYAESIHNRFNQDLKRGQILYSWNFITIKNKFGKLNSLIRSKIGEQLTTTMALEHVKPSG